MAVRSSQLVARPRPHPSPQWNVMPVWVALTISPIRPSGSTAGLSATPGPKAVLLADSGMSAAPGGLNGRALSNANLIYGAVSVVFRRDHL